MTGFDASAELTALLDGFGLPGGLRESGDQVVRSPVDGSVMARIGTQGVADLEERIARAEAAFAVWRLVPAPQRGALVRRYGEVLRQHKVALGRLVSLEAGKILSEGQGEVQEMIDIAEFAVGLSRQLHGLTIASERPGHRMMESWHPLGVIGVISAFNFPVAVWSWNAMLALVCGDAVIWKPSEKTPLTALVSHHLLQQAAADCGVAVPEGLFDLVIGGVELGQALAADRRIALLSATGSTRMGKAVAPVVAARLGRSLLELGGNNAILVAPSADLRLALPAITFGAVGTCGQRCTSTRRVIAHESIVDALSERLERIYGTLAIGNPLQAGTLVGPLIDQGSAAAMGQAIAQAKAEGGVLVTGGETLSLPGLEGGAYVRPAILRMPGQTAIVQHETFAPILYVLTYRSFDEALALHNAVPQGLSSAIFTTDLREAEAFLSASGSDCGIANVNIGTSGAEIGGAFGGEKETGGGRESGSDAWKIYMRRATNTINYSSALPLAQGVRFDVEDAAP